MDGETLLHVRSEGVGDVLAIFAKGRALIGEKAAMPAVRLLVVATASL